MTGSRVHESRDSVLYYSMANKSVVTLVSFVDRRDRESVDPRVNSLT